MRQAIRRSLSALVMLALILIVAPTLAGHTASAATIVSNVTITGVEVPEIGETPDYYATATATGATLQNYNEGSWKRGVRWVNETDNKNMSATDTFKAGKVYAVYFCIEPKSGYTFKNSSGNVVTKATVNGKATGTPTMFDDGTLEVKYTFLSLKRKVGAVTITGVDTPVIGKTPDYVVSVSGTGTKRDNFNTTWWKNGVAWRDVTADASMKTTDTFKAGHSYMVRVSLYPADGYSFSNAAGDLIASGKIGGKEAETLLLGDENVIFEYTFPALVNPIPYVVISGVDAPVIGRTPDYDVNVTGTGVKRDTVTNDTCKNGVFWMDETTGWKVKTTETFQAGHTYKVCVSLYAETDYAFFDIAGNLTKGTINGKPAEAHEYSFDKTNYGYEYTFPALPERTIVSDAAIAVTAPKAGNAPVFKATMTATGAKVKGDYADNDFRNGVRWTNVTDNRHMKPTDVFEEGKVYKVDVYLVSDHESGYVFVDGLSLVRTKATVNEGTAAATRNSDTSITVSYEFPLLNRVIRTVTITDVDAPVAGLTPDYDITMSPEGFHRHEFSNDSLTEGVYWDDVTDNKRVKKTDTFIEGHEYKMTVTLISDDGYTFLDESGDIAATGTIDGIATETSKENGIDRVFIYFKCIFPKAKATALIESVAITDVDAPEAGATPDYDVTVNGKGVVRDNYTGSSWMNGVLWRDITADAPVNPTDTFVAGHQYKVFVSLISDASYTFYNEGGDVATTGTINGFAAETHKYSTGAGFSYAFPALPVPVAPAALIESVAITDVDAPAAGQTPDYDVTVSGEGCHKEDYNDDSTKGGVYWYDVTADSAVKTTDTFIGGHEYMVVVYMTSDDGYTFLNAGGDVATAGTINGNAAETHKGGAYVSFMYTFPKVAVPATLIESVTITGVDAPVAGATPDYDATVSGTGCIKSTHNTGDGWNNGMFWYDNTASKALIPTDTFVAGHEYRVIVWVMSKGGYTFLNESGDVATPGTINGNAAGTVKYGTTSVGFKYDFPALPEAAAPATLIESVTITGLDAPVAGATPDCDVTVSATGCYKRDYSNEWIKDGVAWYDLTASKAIKTTDTFIAGHAYRVDVYMISEDGYTFYNADGSAATAGTINGNAAETDRYNATLLLFMYTFPALPEAEAPATLVESVTITDVDAPVVGATPDFDVTVSGTGCHKEDYNVDTSSDYWKDGVKWADKTTHTFLRPTDTFLAGHEYSVVVSMVSESGYTFYNADGSVATAGTIDGNAAETDKWNPSTLYLYVFFPKLPGAETPATLIESVAITGVTAPVAGQTPSYDVTVNTAGCHRQDYTNDWWKDGVSWRDMTTGETLAATETFIAGHEYRVYVHLTCEDGFIFFDTTNGVITTATINGKDVSFYQYTHPSIGFYYTFPAVTEPEPEHLFPVDFYGFAEYEGGLFYVYQGDVVTDANGLVNDPNNPADWYFCANGQAQLQYSGLAEYGGEWFYLENGKLNTARVGIVTYDGGRFMIAAGRILREVNGLIQDPNTGLWYYVAAGQVADYTGLVQYDGAWFYVINGELATGYTGPVEYNGATFQVVNGQMVA